MEFISNLIKRPISLVMSDSVEQSSPNNSNSNTSPHHRDHSANNSNNHSNNIHNNNINKNCKNAETLEHKGSSCIKNSKCSPIVIDVGAGGDGAHALKFDTESIQNLNTSTTSSSSTSTTIEELLIQINDNLNQAHLQDTVDKHVQLEECVTNVMTSSDVLSPLSAKSTNKLTQSPQTKSPLTPTSLHTPSSPNVAAGTAVFEANSSLNKFLIGSDVETEAIDKTPLNHNNSGVSKRSKFVGLTEYDESNIPELPGSLNPNIDDQLKFTFAEDLIPTLTTSSFAKPLNAATKKDDTTKIQQVFSSGADTAVSSDNETYAECHSFLDIGSATSTFAPVDLGYDENTSLSDADAFRSALNSHNNTILDEATEERLLNGTMENVTDIADEIFESTTKTDIEQTSLMNDNQLSVLSHSVEKLFQINDVTNAAFHGNNNVPEPMDVDMNDSDELAYENNLTMEAADHLLFVGVAEKPEVISNSNDSMEEAKACLDKGLECKSILDVTQVMPLTSSCSTVSNDSIEPSRKIEPESLSSAQTAVTEDFKFASLLIASQDMTKANDSLAFSKDTMDDSNLQAGKASKIELGSSSSTLTHAAVKDEIKSIPDISLIKKRLTFSNDATELVNKVAAEPSSMTFTEDKDVKTQSLLDTSRAISMKKANDLQASSESTDSKIEPGSSSSTLTLESFPQLSPEATAANQVKPELSLGALNLSAHNRLTFSIEKEQSPITNETNVPSEISSIQIDAPGCIQFPTTKVSNNSNVIQDNNIDSATDGHTAAVTHSILTVSDNTTEHISSTGTEIEEHASQNKKQPMQTSSLSASTSMADAKMNLTLDINASFEPAAMKSTLQHSPSFPIKSSLDKKHFPRSPNVSRQNVFLEKSDYSSKDHLNASSHKKATEQNLNETVNISGASSMSSIPNAFSPLGRPVTAATKKNNLSLSSLNCTFDHGTSLPSPTMTTSSTELHNTSINKRRTFSISPTPLLQSENSLNTSRPNSRLTFNLPTEPEPCLEAMDVDSPMQAATALQSSDPEPQKKMSPTLTTSSGFLANSSMRTELLSAKEQTKSNAKDEKDIFVEKFVPSAIEDMFASSSLASAFDNIGASCSHLTATANSSQNEFECNDEEFHNNLILNPSDFDYLLTKGNNNVQVDRSSLLLRFDPLLGVPVPVNQPQQKHLPLQQILINNNPICLSPTLEEEDEQHSNRSFVIASDKKAKLATASKSEESAKVVAEQHIEVAQDSVQCKQQQQILSQEQAKAKKNARMSVDVIKDMKIENDCNKSIENSNTQSDEIQNNFKMDELEKKIKNEVLKTEDIEKKLREAEQREEALIKRITEKDKTNAKMNGVIEAYEKAIAELISEKEQLIQNYEKQLAEVKADRDSNYHHLTSLETTFSDLHVKFEKSKEMTLQLKSSEESLLAEKKQNLEDLRLQEQRYEKMKNHAMQQLEIANKKLEALTKEHGIETTKLKALLKKEEISRASTNEQLQQKSRENAELMKICDELINGQGS